MGRTVAPGWSRATAWRDETKNGRSVGGERTDAEKAMDTLEFLSQDAAARMAYDARMKALSDEHSRIESAEEKGRTDSSREIAIRLLDRGIDLQTISEATGLSVEEIKEARKFITG